MSRQPVCIAIIFTVFTFMVFFIRFLQKLSQLLFRRCLRNCTVPKLYGVKNLYIKYNNLNILIKTIYNIVNLYLIDSHKELNIHSRLRTQMSVLWSDIRSRRYRNIVCSAPTDERQFLVLMGMYMCINSNGMEVHKSVTPRHVPNHDSVLKFLGWYVENPT
jgi:hypothetical protein